VSGTDNIKDRHAAVFFYRTQKEKPAEAGGFLYATVVAVAGAAGVAAGASAAGVAGASGVGVAGVVVSSVMVGLFVLIEQRPFLAAQL